MPRTKQLRTSGPQQVMAAMPIMENVRPAFTVRKIEQDMPHKVNIFDKESNKIKSKTIMEPGGFLVTFRKGHSIRVRNELELKRLGANVRLIPLMDDEGEVKGMVQNIELAEDEGDLELTGE
jgi:predicted RNA-binding protein